MLFVCPKCRGELFASDTGVFCERSHSYDRSKYGYYNLLLSSVGGIHGDNREMVEARRAFLDGGFYQPLCDKVSELVLKHTKKHGAILDAGCGEGYYTEAVEQAVTERDGRAEIIAFDISKEAIRRMKKRCISTVGAVASCYSMPIGDGVIDTVVNIFSPMAAEETHRVMKHGGKFIVAAPDKEHLFGLKSVLYDTPYKNAVSEDAPPGFFEVERHRVKYSLTLTSQSDIHNLFMMTPYAYRTPAAGRQRLSELSTLTTEVDFTVFVYEKRKM